MRNDENSFEAYNLKMSSINKILVPTDFSPAAWRSVKMAIDFSHTSNACITLLHVFPSNTSFRGVPILDKKPETHALNDMKNQMAKFCTELQQSSQACIKPVWLEGEVKKSIIHYIQNEPHDLVIIGVNSNGVNNETGSHTVQIIESSGTPVLVVPNVDEATV